VNRCITSASTQEPLSMGPVATAVVHDACGDLIWIARLVELLSG